MPPSCDSRRLSGTHNAGEVLVAGERTAPNALAVSFRLHLI
jgi:hypothetical protein